MGTRNPLSGMENFIPSRNTSTMFVPVEWCDYSTCKTHGSYSDGRNEAGVSDYPAVPHLLGCGILYGRTIKKPPLGFDSPIA
jgi:hypothetical protein